MLRFGSEVADCVTPVVCSLLLEDSEVLVLLLFVADGCSVDGRVTDDDMVFGDDVTILDIRDSLELDEKGRLEVSAPRGQERGLD